MAERSTAIAEAAIAEVVVPNASDVDLQDLFQAWDGEIPEDSTSMVPFIEPRQFILLDELLTAYVLLRIPALDEDELKQFISRLAITVETRATGQIIDKPGDARNPAVVREATEALSAEAVNISEEPLMCATEIQPEDDAEPQQYLFLFWKVIIPIGRPKTRLQKLAVFFNPITVLNPPKAFFGNNHDNEYLPSIMPTSTNLLQSFTSDPSLAGINPHLSASRITRPFPSAPALNESSRPIKIGARRLFRAAPAFLWRIRFLRFPGLAEKDAILACFDIEITPFAACDVSLDSISLKLSSGSYEAIGVNLPQRGRPAEQFTLTYKILPPSLSDRQIPDPGASRSLTISLSSTILVSDICIPKVKIKWKTALELPPSRPTSRAGPMPLTPLEPLSSIEHDALVMTGEVIEFPSAPAVAEGVSLTISGPEKIVAEEAFSWEVLIVNRSERPQRFALIPIPKRKATDIYAAARRPSSTGSSIGSNGRMVNPVLDDNILYSTQKGSTIEPAEILCLTPDVRVGALGPSACYVAELQFLPMKAGVLQLEALRLVDLATQQTVDIRQLPDIVVCAKS
ncbi:hypothetical protein BT63DRAFT_292685 [Microthyrium microscopicum]|uniref:Trafficking protein particle complex II-specific subunit 65 IgD3 domain-containing protein n=1 Tax=Microthyrium microscopicum TaxID=703497 RepID=A0A6A6U5A2_9PEZI|nr:hypothetical protein BT63DRAFT_292685 [Microthyrium microscopicum]